MFSYIIILNKGETTIEENLKPIKVKIKDLTFVKFVMCKDI